MISPYLLLTGRKIPLECIREKMNFKHKEYFRIHTDNQLEQLTKTEIINELIRIAYCWVTMKVK